jgi:hypothetical protein
MKYIKKSMLPYIFYLMPVLLVIILLLSRKCKSKEHHKHHNHNNRCNRCDCGLQFMAGKSKCYDCDKQLARQYCTSCDNNGVPQDYLMRELSVNKPNAKLGYLDN